MEPWEALAQEMLNRLDVDNSIRIYRDVLRNPGMVMTLEEIDHYGDLNLLLGHISALIGEFDNAQVSGLRFRYL
jgi:hypothetical protein